MPTLVDHEFTLWESKAIMIYLAEKCPRFAHSMYPKCVKTRAIIHQRLFHDSSSFYIRILDIANLAFSSTANPVITVQHRDNLNKALSVLEVRAGMPATIIHPQVLWSAYLQCFLEGYEYFAGNQITIADLSYLASMTTLIVSWDGIPPFLLQ